MNQTKTNQSVFESVGRSVNHAVFWSVFRTVDDALYQQVYWVVYSNVHAMYNAVNQFRGHLT